MRSIEGGSESPKERIERLVAEGWKSREEIERAERVWRDRLRGGIALPTSETVHVTLDDLYHVVVDDRISRKPERIELALRGIFEVREAERGRRLALSRWQEEDRERLAALIIDATRMLQSLHLIDQRRLERYRRQAGAVEWTQ